MNLKPSTPNALVELTRARLREFLREKAALFWVFGFPLLMALGLGLAFRAKPTDLPRVAVIGERDGPLVEALVASKQLSAVASSRSNALAALGHAKVDIAVGKKGAGKLVIGYSSLEQLDGILARLR